MSKIALVTGANQGLGLALAEGLARELGPGDVVYLTGRDPERVEAAAASIAGARADVVPDVLDVGDGDAIDAYAQRLRDRHGGVDVVFDNAVYRLFPDDDAAGLIDTYAAVNNLSTTRFLRSFPAVMRPGGRLLVVASSLGTLDHLPEHLQPRFDEALTLDAIDAEVLRWTDAVRDGRAADEGWPDFINIPSKVAQVAAVRIAARDHDPRQLFVASLCPGMIDTATSRPWFDMTGAQTPEEAAAAPLRLALDPAPEPALHGELVRFGAIVPWRGRARAHLHD